MVWSSRHIGGSLFYTPVTKMVLWFASNIDESRLVEVGLLREFET